MSDWRDVGGLLSALDRYVEARAVYRERYQAVGEWEERESSYFLSLEQEEVATASMEVADKLRQFIRDEVHKVLQERGLE